MVDESFTQRITSILRSGRSEGPSLSGEGKPVEAADAAAGKDSGDDRERLLRIAAGLAVIRMRQAAGSDPAARGRSSGTSYAEDHRRAMLGRSNSLVARAARTIWR